MVTPKASETVSAETFNYDHQVRMETRTAPPASEIKSVSIRRFGDTTQLKGSVFDRSQTNEIAFLDLDDESIKKIIVRELTPETNPVLFTEKVTDALVSSGFFKVIERADIEHIIRELKFEGEGAEEDLSAKKASFSNLKDVDLIVTGRYGTNDRFIEWCLEMDKKIAESQLESPGGQLSYHQTREICGEIIKKVPPRRVLILRAYEVQTGEVVASTTVEGETDTSLIAKAIDKLKRQIYP